MKRRSGIALVTTLFILVAVLLMGVGSLFLTRTNLRVAENVRTNAIARNNANSGIEAAYLLLESYHDAYDTFPTSANDFSLPSNAGFELSAYRFDNADQVMVRIKGTTVRGAEHESEALFRLDDDDPEVPSVYSLGLVSEGTVRVTPQTAVHLDSGVHGNAGVNLKGDFYVCTNRDSDGLCTSQTLVNASELPITVSDANAECRIDNSNCDPADYYADPVSINVDYTGRRDAALDLDGDGDFDNDDCFGSLPAAAVSMGNVVVCTTGDVTLNNALLNDVVIVTDGDITLTGSATLTDTLLVSTGGTVSIASGTMQDTRIYSQGNLSFTGNSRNYVWSESNTVATAGSITFNGSGKDSNHIDPIDNGDGTKSVGMVLLAEGDVTFNGRNTGNDKYYSTFIVGGTFTQNGRSETYGSINSVGDLRFNGNFYIDSEYEIVNPDLMEYPEPFVNVLSRR